MGDVKTISFPSLNPVTVLQNNGEELYVIPLEISRGFNVVLYDIPIN